MRVRDFLSQLRSWRFVSLTAAVVALTFVHQLSGVHSSRFHQVLDVVPYVLIMLGALWYGLPGAIICAALTSTCYTLHLVIQEGGGLDGGGLFSVHFHRTLNIFMYLLVGVFTGILGQRQIDALRRHRAVAQQLTESYAELRAKTEELFRVEEHIQRANRLCVAGELAAGLAHEIGNPLGGIKGAAEIIADRVQRASEEGRFTSLLLAEVDRLDGVVSRFLEFVRPPSDTLEHARLSDVLDSILSLLDKTLGKQSIDLRLEIDDAELSEVAAAPQQLYQVFLNLLLNAIQATPVGGSIGIRARSIEGGVECSVSDTGHGIAPEDLPRIFEPFFSRRPGGTGLGLAITSKIVDSCGGRIEVSSEPGHGATFRVTLPASRHDDAHQSVAGRR
jgi:two-component system sensor histidine kinase HydH